MDIFRNAAVRSNSYTGCTACNIDWRLLASTKSATGLGGDNE
jgi:hypothetical protein